MSETVAYLIVGFVCAVAVFVAVGSGLFTGLGKTGAFQPSRRPRLVFWLASFDVAGLTAGIADFQEATKGSTGPATDPTFAERFSHQVTSSEVIIALGLAALLFFAARTRSGGAVTAVIAGVTTVLTVMIVVGFPADAGPILIVCGAVVVLIAVATVTRSSAQARIVAAINFAAVLWTVITARDRFHPRVQADVIAYIALVVLTVLAFAAFWVFLARFPKFGGNLERVADPVLDFIIGLAGIGAIVCVAYLREGDPGVNDLFSGVAIMLVFYLAIWIVLWGLGRRGVRLPGITPSPSRDDFWSDVWMGADAREAGYRQAEEERREKMRRWRIDEDDRRRRQRIEEDRRRRNW